MPRNASFSLDSDLAAFVKRQVALGRYASAGDVVEAALRLLEEHETRLNELRVALIEGERSGPSEPFDIEGLLAGERTSRL